MPKRNGTPVNNYNQVKPEFFGLYFYPFFFYAKKCRRMIA
nr:MAG TPA: hypothetical protein [Caudoviricetes sp.]